MSGMAEVLARRNFEHEWGGDWGECPEDAKPGWLKDAQETLDFLSAAGFGSVVEARAAKVTEAQWKEAADMVDYEMDFGEPNPVVVVRTYTEAELVEAKAEALLEAANDPTLRLSGHSGISITRLRARAAEMRKP